MSRILSLLSRLSALLLLSITLAACVGLGGEPAVVATLTPAPILTPQPENGAQLFAANCVRCHGLDGAGQGELVLAGQIGEMPSFQDAGYMSRQSFDAYYAVIANGRIEKLMPPWKDALTPQEIADVAQFVLTWHRNPELQVAEATPPPIVGSEFTISGTVSNGTAGASVPADLDVYLRYGNSTAGVQTIAGKASDGAFRFEDVPYDAEAAYVVVAVYNERNFASTVLEASQAAPENDLPLTIYERTEDPFVLSISAIDILIEPFPAQLDPALGRGVLVTQTMTYTNSSDRLFSLSRNFGGRYPSVLVFVPPGAVILSGAADDPDNPRYIVAQEQYALIDTFPILPGEHTLEAAYYLPYNSDAAVIDLVMNNALQGDVSITTTPKTLTVTGEGFSEQASDAPVVNLYRASGLNIPSNESLIFRLQGTWATEAETASSSSTTISSDLLLPVGLLIVLGVLLVGLGLWLNGKQRGASQAQAQIDALIAQIAALDARHASGDLNHDAYQRQRADLKAQVAALMGKQTPPSVKE